MMLSLGNLLLFAAATAVYLLSWCLGARCCCNCCSFAILAMLSLVGACFCCLLPFTFCLGAVYCCCCCSLIIAVLVMHSLGARFCCCCHSFAVLGLASAAGVVIWIFWFVLCFVDVPIAETQH
ncbi:hypothetical protein MAM1_0982d11398 [Mucor ambiguus]|uniref:Transmembrane protein n=1 Tax=Mucor ambiguus TaxID=91626 RepID=A0A0C9N6W7_9FUNG|nr:hypothetical protein MAM1_0982d11398 [Mucor ambiguus]